MRYMNYVCKINTLIFANETMEMPHTNYNHGNKLYGQLPETALSLTPQAMYNQFKRPSAGSVRELYYIYRKT